MAFDLTGLVAYVEENAGEMATKAITGSKIWTLGWDVRNNIKSSEKIPKLEQSAPFYAASSCAVNASGDTTVTQTSISTSPIAISPEFCINDLEAYFTQKYLKNGANKNDEFGFFGQVMDRLSAVAARNVGMQLIQGKTTYSTTYLKQINGLISAIDTAGTAIAATQQASISTSTVRGIFEEIIFEKITSAMRSKGVVVYCGADAFMTLLRKLWIDNHYHVAPGNEMGTMEMTYPYTNVKIIAIPELNNDNPVETGSLPTAVKNRIIATYPSNIVIGVDKQNDFEEFDVWFDKNTRKLKMYARFRLGITAHYFDHIVQYTNS